MGADNGKGMDTLTKKIVMHPCWTKEQVADIVDLVRVVHGLNVSSFDETFLIQSLNKRLTETSTATVEYYFDLLHQDASEAQALLASMNVVYSEFFRNSPAFALLEHILLPEICNEKEKSGQGEIRVWSAGCATGQEAWSIAILLDELLKTRKHLLSYRIIATDRLESVLSQAREGCYRMDALGNIKMRHLDTSFTRRGDSFVVVPRLREKVTFSFYDLFDTATTCPPESIFGHFDLVFCCNILLYYRQQIQALILKKIQQSLTPSGYLITDTTEGGIIKEIGGFKPAIPQAAIFRKISIFEGLTKTPKKR